MVSGPGASHINPECPEIVLWDVLWELGVVWLDKIGCIAEMPLSDSQVKAEQPGSRRRNVSVGDSLFLVIESVSRGGGKSFEGRMRFPTGGRASRCLCGLACMEKAWEVVLKEAWDEWDRIRSWSKQNGTDPRNSSARSSRH